RGAERAIDAGNQGAAGACIFIHNCYRGVGDHAAGLIYDHRNRAGRSLCEGKFNGDNGQSDEQPTELQTSHVPLLRIKIANARAACRACGSAAWSVVSNQGPQSARSFGRAQLTKRLGFDLAYALARNAELLTDLLQGMLSLAADPKSQSNYLFFL